MSAGDLFRARRLGSRDAAVAVVAGVLGAAVASYGVTTYLAAVRAALRADPAITAGPVWPAPRKQLSATSASDDLPYPPDALPGGRVVDTPYGSTQVFEWGPETGDKVLLLPGISTPVLALGNLGNDLANRGYRVMMFDLFGRGWSDCPSGVTHDARLYITQILLVLASSPLPWTGHDSFHLIGYSFGGCLSGAFTRYLPNLVRSLTLITPGGLIRRSHISWKSRLLYSRGLLPPWLLAALVRKRLRTPPSPAPAAAEAAAGAAAATDETEGENPPAAVAATLAVSSRFSGNSDANGGDSFDHAVLRPERPEVTVSTVCSWQLEAHPGFLPAFISSLQSAPIYEQQGLWSELGRQLATKRRAAAAAAEATGEDGVKHSTGRVLLVLGSSDPVIVKDEMEPDMKAVLGDDTVEVVVIEGGHEIPISESKAIADAAIAYWSK